MATLVIDPVAPELAEVDVELGLELVVLAVAVALPTSAPVPVGPQPLPRIKARMRMAFRFFTDELLVRQTRVRLAFTSRTDATLGVGKVKRVWRAILANLVPIP